MYIYIYICIYTYIHSYECVCVCVSKSAFISSKRCSRYQLLFDNSRLQPSTGAYKSTHLLYGELLKISCFSRDTARTYKSYETFITPWSNYFTSFFCQVER